MHRFRESPSPSRREAVAVLAALLAAFSSHRLEAVFVGLSTVGAQYFENEDLVIYAPSDGDRFAFAMAGGDFNGDGVDDLATGIPFHDGPLSTPFPDMGIVVVRYGIAGQGLSPAPTATVLSAAVAGSPDPPQEDNRFGAALAAGDFNGDGIDDLAVGSPDNWQMAYRAGTVSIYYGQPGGIQPIPEHLIHQESPDMPVVAAGTEQASPSDHFGSSLAVGNFDGDWSASGHPYEDLAIGAPTDQLCSEWHCGNWVGSVWVLHGGPGGLMPINGYVINQSDPLIPDNAELFEDFGFSLAAGNFNGDQDEFGNEYDDLAIGVPSEDDGGAVLVLLGSPDGLLFQNNLYFSQWTLFGSFEAGDRFGAALTAGDFDNDGRDDLAIGAPSEDFTVNNTGEVDVVFGSSSGSIFNFARTQAWLQSLLPFGIDQAGDRFGASLAAADFDRDGFSDLAIGLPGEDLGQVDRGGIFLLRGKSSGLYATARFLSFGYSGVPGTPQDSQDVGHSLATGDFDGNGHPDLAIGAPYRTVPGAADGGGQVVLYGSLFADGFDSANSWEWSTTNP